MAVVNDVNSVAIAINSSFLGIRNSQLMIIIFRNCYCYYLQKLALSARLLLGLQCIFIITILLYFILIYL